MKPKNSILVGTAFAGIAAIEIVFAWGNESYLAAIGAGLAFAMSILFLKDGWNRRNEKTITYDEWLNIVLDKPLPKRWR